MGNVHGPSLGTATLDSQLMPGEWIPLCVDRSPPRARARAPMGCMSSWSVSFTHRESVLGEEAAWGPRDQRKNSKTKINNNNTLSLCPHWPYLLMKSDSKDGLGDKFKWKRIKQGEGTERDRRGYFGQGGPSGPL